MHLTQPQLEQLDKTVERLRDLTAPSLPLNISVSLDEWTCGLIGQLTVRRALTRDHDKRLRYSLAIWRLTHLKFFLDGRGYGVYRPNWEYVRQAWVEDMCRWLIDWFANPDKLAVNEFRSDGEAFHIGAAFTVYGDHHL